MKHNYFRSLLFLAFGTIIISCSKEDVPVVNSKAEVASNDDPILYFQSFPDFNKKYEPGKDVPGYTKYPVIPENSSQLPKVPFSTIEFPTKEYLDETCLFDISNLENKKTYNRIQNGKQVITFFGPGTDGISRLLKLKTSSNTGWIDSWGISPNVESDAKDVLFIETDRQFLFIHLSKPVTEFGFEMNPNNKNYNHNFLVGFGDFTFDYTKGTVNKTIRNPTGARLIAIKSTKPFTTITIGHNDSPCCTPLTNGIAIGNIRYKLAK